MTKMNDELTHKLYTVFSLVRKRRNLLRGLSDIKSKKKNQLILKIISE